MERTQKGHKQSECRACSCRAQHLSYTDSSRPLGGITPLPRAVTWLPCAHLSHSLCNVWRQGGTSALLAVVPQKGGLGAPSTIPGHAVTSLCSRCSRNLRKTQKGGMALLATMCGSCGDPHQGRLVHGGKSCYLLISPQWSLPSKKNGKHPPE